MDKTDEKTSVEEIEITPAMIAAGVAALVGYNHDFELEEDAAARIYRAMFTARYRALSVEEPFDWCVPDLEAVLRYAEMRGDNALVAHLRQLAGT